MSRRTPLGPSRWTLVDRLQLFLFDKRPGVQFIVMLSVMVGLLFVLASEVFLLWWAGSHLVHDIERV